MHPYDTTRTRCLATDEPLRLAPLTDMDVQKMIWTELHGNREMCDPTKVAHQSANRQEAFPYEHQYTLCSTNHQVADSASEAGLRHGRRVVGATWLQSTLMPHRTSAWQRRYWEMSWRRGCDATPTCEPAMPAGRPMSSWPRCCHQGFVRRGKLGYNTGNFIRE